MGLNEQARYDLSLICLPFKPRPPRHVVFPHRPEQFEGVLPQAELARATGAEVINCESEADIPVGMDLYMVMIGVLLTGDFLASTKVLNCHAGIIPLVRGLDAFKWAILEKQPLGNTLHFIDAEIDAGEIVSTLPTEVRPHDSLEGLAQRHYQSEIDSLINFERHLENRSNSFAGCQPLPPHRRMPMEKEREMMASFSSYLELFAK